jgi:hypothetical protein
MLGSIPNQSSRLDAGFGIHIKTINAAMEWIPGEKAFKFIQKWRPLISHNSIYPFMAWFDKGEDSQ